MWNPTIIRLSVQALFGRRRGLVLGLVPALLILLSITIRLLAGSDIDYGSTIAPLAFTLALPLVALLAAASVLGPEIDDGSIVYLLAKPVSRHSIAMNKFVVAWVATMAFGALPLLVTALILNGGDVTVALGWFVGGAFAGTAYAALFLALAALTRHAVVAGLLFVLLWEGLLGNLLNGIRWVAIGSWGREIGTAISDLVPDPDMGLTYVLIAAFVLTAGSLWFAGDRLRSFTLRGDE